MNETTIRILIVWMTIGLINFFAWWTIIVPIVSILVGRGITETMLEQEEARMVK